MPDALGRGHVEREDMVREPARMRQRHRTRILREALEAEVAIAADQRRAARSDDHLLHLQRLAHQVAGLHQRALDEPVVGCWRDGEPGDLGEVAVAHAVGQHVAAFDQQRAPRVGRDARGAQGRAAGLVARQQDDGVRQQIDRIGLPHGVRELGHVVPVRAGADRTGIGELRQRPGDDQFERQRFDAHPSRPILIARSRRRARHRETLPLKRGGCIPGKPCVAIATRALALPACGQRRGRRACEDLNRARAGVP